MSKHRCPECGGPTKIVTEDDGFRMIVCMTDTCPVIGCGQAPPEASK